MKLTQEIIDQIQEAMLHTKKDGTVNWKDGEEIEVQLAGTFAADRFIVIKNKSKNPVVSAAPHPYFDYEKGVAKCDIFTCGEHCKPYEAVEYLKKHFLAEEVQSDAFDRLL